MPLFSQLQRYAYTGTEQIPCWQPGQSEDGWISPLDMIDAPVLVTQTSAPTVSFTGVNIGVVTEYLGLSNSVFTIQPDGVNGFTAPVGTLFQVEVIGNGTTAGRITFAAGPGVTVLWPKAADGVTDCKITRTIGSTATFRKRVGTNVWFAGASDLTAT